MYIEQSLPTCKEYSTTDPIHLFLQFYIDKDDHHAKEIQFALQKNVENPHITSIVLLNERIYTDNELGVQSDKITQINIHKRLTYSIFLEYPIVGYKVLINADIFLDFTLLNCKTSDIHLHKKMYALLRYEYGENPVLHGATTKYEGRGDSADAWIVHSNHTFSSKELACFNIQLGVPGCDNKVAYVFSILGYTIYNDPLYIKTYHCHASSERKYAPNIITPYACILPANVSCPPPFQLSTRISFSVNTQLLNILKNSKGPILIPFADEVNSVEFMKIVNNVPLNTSVQLTPSIKITTNASAKLYVNLYVEAFHDSSVFSSFEPWEPMFSKSWPFIHTLNKKYLSVAVFDIFNYMYNPWTLALANKTILIISPYADMIKVQPQAYPIDLFPGCKFVYVKASENGLDWMVEFNKLRDQIKDLSFDIALCSCKGYGNPLCAYIYSMNKSAIYIDNLHMFFGIYEKKWLMYKEMVHLYLTKDWKKI
jgi:hypothetical protein